MNFKQKLAILFYVKRSKASKNSKIPIYVRITIDGLDKDFSSGCKVLDRDWDSKTKKVLTKDKSHKEINKKLCQIQTDLERHFDLVQVKHGVATPVLVIESYKTPLNGKQLQEEKVQNLAFSEKLDDLINKYIKYCEKKRKAYEFDQIPSPEKKVLLEKEESDLKEDLGKIVNQANTIFDNKNHQKTLVIAIDEYHLNFLQLVSVNKRSINSLEKMIGRKRRFLEFLKYRYKKEDLPLSILEYKFITDLYNYLLIAHQVNENTASKYAQVMKEIMDRAVANGWQTHNKFALFKCSYTIPEQDLLELDHLRILQEHLFEKPIHNTIRDIFIFCCYTGFSYQEVYNLGPHHVRKSDDGELWASIKRQKTSNREGVPLLPPAVRLIEKYKDHPVAARRNRLFPVPANQTFNRELKVMGTILNFEIELDTHDGRRSFANAITFNNGVNLKTIGGYLGQSSIKTTEVYVKNNKRNLSENMKMVKEKLFDENGELKPTTPVVDINKPLKVVHIASK
ncbi:phage integrase SAM-like domain-containing protein [Chitinophaga sp.]|uniref:site-specific integrase n=1 Tax=Chitinophaga sp. TaxID=1869181 RepID=UPI0031DB022F